jgi:ribonuclease BN (tRNA processing enzyme)
MAELRFLGTCAADFSPRLSADLKDKFDLDARRSSSVLLDDRYLVDCGVHTADSIRIAGVDRKEIKYIFISHLHRDHYDPQNIAYIAERQKEPVKLFVREDAELPYIPNVRIVRMKQFVTYEVDEDMKVTGLTANHDEKVRPRHLLFEYKGKKFFYGLDGGWLINATFNYLRDSHLDLAILDATCGDYEGDYRMAEHNSIPMIRLMLPSLRTVGMIDGHTKIILSHLAPSLHKSHEETVKIAEAFGATVAYDGMTAEF